MKTWVDFAGVVAQFGFPQAFIYAINKRLAKRGPLARWSARYSFCITALAVLASAGASALHFLNPSSSIWLIALCLGLSIGLLTYHRLIRSILLTISDGSIFAIFTIIPSCSLVVVLPLLLMIAAPLEIAFLSSAAVGALAAFLIARRFRASGAIKIFSIAELADQSWLMFAHAVIVSAQPIVVFWLCSGLGATTEQIGLLSIATISIFAVYAVCGMIAPILFNRWSRRLDAGSLASLFSSVTKTGLAVFIAVAVALPIIPWAIPTIFGTEFGRAVDVMQIITMALPAAVYTQVVSPAFLGLGRVKVVIYSSACRLAIVIAALLGLAVIGMSIIHAAAWGWLLGEWAIAACLFVAARRVSSAGERSG